jgi:hypothetical protein
MGVIPTVPILHGAAALSGLERPAPIDGTGGCPMHHLMQPPTSTFGGAPDQTSAGACTPRQN